MTPTEASILRILRTSAEATRPQLAQACGVSLVSINKGVAALTERGELIEVGEVASCGGRPVKVYRLNKDHGHHLLIKTAKEGNILRCTLELLNLMGEPQTQQEVRYGYIDTESLDNRIEHIAAGRQLRSITLFMPPQVASAALTTHLHHQYGCRVYTPSMAGLLTPRKEGTATLCLPLEEAASCAYYRRGKITECGALSLLPAGASWPPPQAEERSLQIETAARIIQILCCILQPQRIRLYTPAWGPRQWERIRYNVGTKLKGAAPPINFIEIPDDTSVELAARAFASKGQINN